jgi:hypothetical protein
MTEQYLYPSSTSTREIKPSHAISRVFTLGQYYWAYIVSEGHFFFKKKENLVEEHVWSSI